jgi:DNA-binding response OmpR family regulator
MIDTFAPDVIVARLTGSPAERVPQLQRGIEIPVILLASDDAPLGERVQARRAGADSVFVEPIHIDEVVARVDTLMEHRRTHQVRRVHDVTIDLDAHVVRRNDVELQLTATEFNLLLDLVTNVGMVLSKRQLLERVWGFDEYDVNVVEAHVSALRRKLEAVGPRLIHTVRGFGYVLRPPPPAEHSHN